MRVIWFLCTGEIILWMLFEQKYQMIKNNNVPHLFILWPSSQNHCKTRIYWPLSVNWENGVIKLNNLTHTAWGWAADLAVHLQFLIKTLLDAIFIYQYSTTWARFLSLAWSKLRLCSANHRPGYWSNLPCDWSSTDWAYSEQETENGPWWYK